MSQTVGVTKAITNLNDVHNRFQLRQTADLTLFPEWSGPFPDLRWREIETCDRLRTRYRSYQAEGAITESTVNLIIIAPLLELLGLNDPPHLIKGEKYVKIEIEDGDRVLDGLIEILVVRDRLWLVLLETKRYGFSIILTEYDEMSGHNPEKKIRNFKSAIASLWTTPEINIFGSASGGKIKSWCMIGRDRALFMIPSIQPSLSPNCRHEFRYPRPRSPEAIAHRRGRNATDTAGYVQPSGIHAG